MDGRPGFLWWLGWLGGRYRADVCVAVPRDAVVDVRVIDGSVVASDLHAGAQVSVTSGRVTLLGLGGRVSAKLISGPVEAVGVAFPQLTVEGAVPWGLKDVRGALGKGAGRLWVNSTSGSVSLLARAVDDEVGP